jgi:hypothetical protein
MSVAISEVPLAKYVKILKPSNAKTRIMIIMVVHDIDDVDDVDTDDVDKPLVDNSGKGVKSSVNMSVIDLIVGLLIIFNKIYLILLNILTNKE